MKISNLSIADYTQKIPKPVPYKETKKNISGGCYIVWCNEELAQQLRPLQVQMHCSTSVFEYETNQPSPLYKDSTIKFALEPVIEATATDTMKGESVFCLYVGKTANLSKRAPHRFKSFFSKLQTETGKKAIIPFDRERCFLSFIEISDWKDRFYTENLLIAALKPIINLQPER